MPSPRCFPYNTLNEIWVLFLEQELDLQKIGETADIEMGGSNGSTDAEESPTAVPRRHSNSQRLLIPDRQVTLHTVPSSLCCPSSLYSQADSQRNAWLHVLYSQFDLNAWPLFKVWLSAQMCKELMLSCKSYMPDCSFHIWGLMLSVEHMACHTAGYLISLAIPCYRLHHTATFPWFG